MNRSLLLSCDAVSKSYGTRSLFEELSFGLFEGDQVGLVGPNGSGKSTLLKILAGLESPDRGTRSLRGGIQLGYVAQDPELPSGLTVEETVAASLTAVEDDARVGGGAPPRPRGAGSRPRRLPRRAPGRRLALRWLAQAPRHRLRLGLRAGRAAHGRADQSSRRRGHSLARGASRRTGAGRPLREPRSLLPGTHVLAHPRAGPGLSMRALRERRHVQRIPRAPRRLPARP